MFAQLILLCAVPATITFETKAARLPVILEKLQPHSTSKLQCQAGFANDVLVVRVDKVQLGTLLDKIAEATVGSWIREDGTLTLVPDLARRKQQEAELASRREKQVQLLLDKLDQELKPTYDRAFLASTLDALAAPVTSSNGYHERISMERQGPLTRLAARTLIEIGAKRLAAIRPGERLVFCSEPNRKQLPWPGLASSLPAFFREWNLFQEVKSTQVDGGRLGGWSRIQGDGRHPSTMETIGVAWLSVSDVVRDGLFSVSIAIANKDGSVVIGNQPNLQTERAPAPPVVYSDAADVPLDLEQDSLDVGEAYKTVLSSERTTANLAPSLRRTLQAPLAMDPLSFGSELYLRYADARKLNLVAWINDNAFARFITSGSKSVMLREFETRSRPNMVFAESPGWLVLTPSSPVEARRSRDDRQVVERLLKSVASEGRLSLDARASYVLRRPFHLTEGLGRHLALMLDQEAAVDSFSSGEDVLRLYGLLAPEQRKRLLAGATLNYGAMDRSQKEIADRMVYGPKTLYNQGQGIYRSDDRFPYEREEYRRPDVDIEPTMVFPEGVPFDAPLTIAPTTGYHLAGKAKDGMVIFSMYDIESLAREVFYEAHPDLVEGDMSSWRRPDLFIASELLTLKLRIDLPSRLHWAGTLKDVKRLTGRVKREDLPQAIKDAVAKEVGRMEDQLAKGYKMKMTVGTSSGGRVIPPRQ